MFWKKSNRNKAREDDVETNYLELKQTINGLQMIAFGLQCTASQFEEALKDLRDYNSASPNYDGENK